MSTRPKYLKKCYHYQVIVYVFLHDTNNILSKPKTDYTTNRALKILSLKLLINTDNFSLVIVLKFFTAH